MAGDCAAAPSHTTGRTVFRIRRLDPTRSCRAPTFPGTQQICRGTTRCPPALARNVSVFMSMRWSAKLDADSFKRLLR